MSNTEVESITKGLDRCTNLLKDLLNEPQANKGQMTQAPKAKRALKVAEKPAVKISKVSSKKCWNYGVKKPVSKAKTQTGTRTSKASQKGQAKTTSFNANLPCSTPIITPIKKEKLQQKPATVSISSSQCSLIELLQEYNKSQLTPTPNGSNETLKNSLKSESQSAENMVSALKESVAKLHEVTSPFNAASGGSIQQQFTEVWNKLNDINQSKITENHSLTNQHQLSVLQSENIELQKQLRSLKQDMRKQDKSQRNEEISLEVAALQCQNVALDKKLKEVLSNAEGSAKVQRDVQDLNMKLQEENESLHKELGMKNDELALSGKLFATETEQIKNDVGNALERVELLRKSLLEADANNSCLTESLKAKEAEIDRLSDLNKSLQATVSRLLGDMQHQPLAPSAPAENHNMSALLLKQLDNILSIPLSRVPSKPTSPRYPQDLPVFLPKSPIYPLCDRSPLELNFLSPSSSTVEVSRGSPPVISTMSDPSSASSSMISINTKVENDFSAGLANLDADIRKLQESLRIK